jgi:hypothetical protein
MRGDVLRADDHRLTERRLLGHQEAGHAPVGGAAPLGHAQGEILYPALTRGEVEQSRHRIAANLLVGIG